jgi:hypothetical protein
MSSARAKRGKNASAATAISATIGNRKRHQTAFMAIPPDKQLLWRDLSRGGVAPYRSNACTGSGCCGV